MSALEGGAGEALPAVTRLSVLAIELPAAITPTVAGLSVGAFVGVVGFLAVMLLVDRGQRRPARRAARMDAGQVVFIPQYTPYGALPRDTPLPPQAFATPYRAHGAYGPTPFVPSTALSARAFAKMGYADVAEPPVVVDSPYVDPSVFFEVGALGEEDLVPSDTPAPGQPVVAVTPALVLPAPAPHPLGVIPATSSAMRAAPIADLAYDDDATEIGETYFDEPPQPRRRTDPPRIRAVQPAGPRFSPQTPVLPQVTPPPARVASAPQHGHGRGAGG